MDRARLAVLVAVVFWGISFVAPKVALREFPPGALVFARIALGAALLLGLLAARGGVGVVLVGVSLVQRRA